MRGRSKRGGEGRGGEEDKPTNIALRLKVEQERLLAKVGLDLLVC